MPKKSELISKEEQDKRDALGIALKKRDLEARRTLKIKSLQASYKQMLDPVPTEIIKDYLAIYRRDAP